jgi:hypothetical protein
MGNISERQRREDEAEEECGGQMPRVLVCLSKVCALCPISIGESFGYLSREATDAKFLRNKMLVIVGMGLEREQWNTPDSSQYGPHFLLY